MKASGFTLLESLVALVILSTVFAFVWEWFGTAVITSRKIEAAVELPFIYEQAQDQLQLEDFNVSNQGSFQLNEFKVIWEAKELRNSTTELFRKNPAWIVALYEVTLTFEKNGSAILKTNTKIVKQWRDVSYVPRTL